MHRDRNPDVTERSHDVLYRRPVVRTSSRNRSALAGLGLLAALVAVAAGDTTASRPADASVGQQAPELTVQDVDFTEVAQPGHLCAEPLSGAPPRIVALDGGTSPLLDESTLARVEVDDDVAYGDLDGDGRDEAVVHATCAYGANGVVDSVQVWSVRGRLPMLVDTVDGAPEEVAEDSAFPPTVLDVDVDGDEVVVTFTHHDDGDPHCCPSRATEVRYELDGGLEVTGEPTTVDLETAA